jgi:TetR/AcrR family transcriptional regulator, transcriptional repressor for nem operon
MKVSKEHLAEIRAALVKAASRLFRERGIDGVGIAKICKHAGLTHGALYAHFPSKQALAGEALSHGLATSYERLTAARDGGAPILAAILDAYLSVRMRDDWAGGCAMAASASEIARQDERVSARFCESFEQIVDSIEATLGTSESDASDRERSFTIVAALIGGAAVARGVAKANPALSEELPRALRKVSGHIAGNDAEAGDGGSASRAKSK